MIWKNGLPAPTGRDGTRKTMQILAAAPARMSKADDTISWARALRSGLQGVDVPAEVVDGSGSAVFGIHERGGTVVDVGSCGWSYGLAEPGLPGQSVTRIEPAGPPGTGFRIRVGDASLTGKIGKTGGWTTLERVSVGTLELPAAPAVPPKTPASSLNQIRVHPAMRVELVAAEPLGTDGKGGHGGLVKFLEDVDGDGRAHLFDIAGPFHTISESVPVQGEQPAKERRAAGLVGPCSAVIYRDDLRGGSRLGPRQPERLATRCDAAAAHRPR